MDINLKQVIHNVKEAYVGITGDTDDITYGNISTKISEIQTGGGIEGGYTVTFKVDNNDYYIASCQQGESITEPPTPTGTGVFTAWQLNGTDVPFPYTPSADVELTANFATVRTEMEVNNTTDILWTFNGTDYTKANANKAICGSIQKSGYTPTLMLVATTLADTKTSPNMSGSTTTGDITYNGTKYYFSRLSASVSNLNSAFVVITNEFIADTSLATKILDHYFHND